MVKAGLIAGGVMLVLVLIAAVFSPFCALAFLWWRVSRRDT